MVFDSEAAFEEAVIDGLKSYGWDDAGGVLRYPTEQDLIDNWASILYENNKHRDCLNNVPLTATEMQQIIEQVVAKRTPVAINELINGKEIVIKRDNPGDKLHEGRDVALKIFHRDEIAGGSSRYQIAQQPVFPSKSKLGHDRRGDLMLLINGMPLFHIELKKSGVPVSEAAGQIRKYAHEGVFTRLFSLVQIFVAMTPEETKYFANPGPDGAFNEKFQFHWANFNNEPVNHWLDVVKLLLSIPMAHQLIGYYTVADDSDGVLKVMRSYQYFAASRISDRVTKIDRDKLWGAKGLKGGYVWHTTGSGKTMTSFKCAQLIANSKDADKVVFLVDRIELGTQSLEQYRSFASATEAVQQTESTDVLKAKLKSSDPSDTLIVTSIQKMGNIDEDAMSAADLEAIRKKRMVFIVDECHRSTFGKNMETIRRVFPSAVLFGFTGTPIHEENRKKLSTTTDVFGDELHRYSIADGIRDGNVLGFDTYPVATYPEFDLRQAVALDEAKARSIEEVMGDPRREQVYYQVMDLPMAPYENDRGERCHGIESMVAESQYGAADQAEVTEHQRQVVADILKHWPTLSRMGKFHAVFATHSIPEAIDYYHLFKEQDKLPLSVTVLVDPSIDNEQERIDKALIKQDALEEIIGDYNERYGKEFALGTWPAFKTDVSNRLAHKRPYLGIEKKPEERLDILIVVDQMLTGFDSKWINALYLDKILRYEMIIQAFSRTNRLFNENEKPFGVIRYYRRPHTMRKYIEEAISLYSGDKPFGLFVPKLRENLLALNGVFDEISSVFHDGGVEGFLHLPENGAAKAKFTKLFREFDLLVEAAKVQGFTWDESDYDFPVGEDVVEELAAAISDVMENVGAELVENREIISVRFDETDYLTLAQRYKELPAGEGRERGGADIPYDISGYLMDIDTTKIDQDYMNANFSKWLKQLDLEGADAAATEAALAALHKTFATLSQEEQKYANLFIHDVQSGDVFVDSAKTFRDYITEYQRHAQDERIARAGDFLGVNVAQLAELLSAGPDEESLNEFGRFDKLMDTVDLARAREYLSALEGASIPAFKVKMRADSLLRRFILEGGFDL
ncbi:type I restriction endonuclease subunit R, EcoR124 family [Adlercreutzia muris]|uniref:type I restriction endonuclease subunit R, EcoR124 family n=1 Tax=Adlercreutzia muris TaxID=1796610 RepID=UPI003518ADA8